MWRCVFVGRNLTACTLPLCWWPVCGNDRMCVWESSWYACIHGTHTWKYMCIAHHIANSRNLDPILTLQTGVYVYNHAIDKCLGAQPWELGQWVKDLLWPTNSPHTPKYPKLAHKHYKCICTCTFNVHLVGLSSNGFKGRHTQCKPYTSTEESHGQAWYECTCTYRMDTTPCTHVCLPSLFSPVSPSLPDSRGWGCYLSGEVLLLHCLEIRNDRKICDRDEDRE